jgi:2-keto-4-pentenoate hydratase/2-oxohepta-3-ene-1,7-dioic acid hydratase in catechol pathway
VSKVVCVGSNYAKHIKEMGSGVRGLRWPGAGYCQSAPPVQPHDAPSPILQAVPTPWEKAKGFDNACPISGFIPAAEFNGDPQNMPLSRVKKRDI